MGVEKNIVVLELGSSAVRAMIGQKKPDGSLQILGFEKENAPDSVHKGVVYNIDKTIQAIAAVIKRIEERQKVFVNKVYVGVTGQSLRSIGNTVKRQLDVKVAISDEIIDSLRDENRLQPYPNAEILDFVTQEYRVGNHLTVDPVGIMADHIEGYFKNIVARKVLCDNLRRCLEGAKLEPLDIFISPLLLAGYLLSDPEKRSGCALVDFGAETTTVVIYEKNILRHLAVIPLGGDNITTDIASTLHIEHEEAENLKRTHGSAYTEEADMPEGQTINISNDRRVEEKRILNIVEARQQEILYNVWEQIKNYSDRLLSGVIFTGGAANMRQLETAFVRYHHFDKVKTRMMPAVTEYATNLRLDPQTNTLATLVAMLRRGDDECTSERPIEPDLFEPSIKEEPTITGLSAAKEGGVVMQPKAETEEIPVAPEPPAEQPKEQPEQPKKEPKPKGPGAFSRMGKWFKDLAADLVEEK
ncbi:MAG: cell division protein FtsA [Bacteroidaceae bacterium]|nr:cell division protein FtsA [Bacteroidaceae bacterium]